VIVVLSGEGVSDIGSCTNGSDSCAFPDFTFGPMTFLIDKIISQLAKYSPLEATPYVYRYYSKSALLRRAEERKKEQRYALTGKKHSIETGYFYINAWMLGEIAKELEAAENDVSISVFFRDADGTNSSPENLWDTKFKSIVSGFERAGYERGIPMLPLPKSEAWLLCAIKDNPYQNCAALEDLPGNDASPNSAKAKLDNSLGGRASAQNLLDWLQDNVFEDERVAEQMPSFAAFRTRALRALNQL